MSKTTQTPDDGNRVAALERELELMRETHSAELAAIRNDIRAAREGDLAAAAGRIFNQMAERVDDMDIEKQRRKMEEKRLAQCAAHDDEVKGRWQDLVSGERLFFVYLLERGKDKKTGAVIRQAVEPAKWQPPAAVGASTQQHAEEKYKSFYGITAAGMDPDQPTAIFSIGLDDRRSRAAQQELLGTLAKSENDFVGKMQASAMKEFDDTRPQPPAEEMLDIFSEATA